MFLALLLPLFSLSVTNHCSVLLQADELELAGIDVQLLKKGKAVSMFARASKLLCCRIRRGRGSSEKSEMSFGGTQRQLIVNKRAMHADQEEEQLMDPYGFLEALEKKIADMAANVDSIVEKLHEGGGAIGDPKSSLTMRELSAKMADIVEVRTCPDFFLPAATDALQLLAFMRTNLLCSHAQFHRGQFWAEARKLERKHRQIRNRKLANRRHGFRDRQGAGHRIIDD